MACDGQPVHDRFKKIDADAAIGRTGARRADEFRARTTSIRS
ncbi:DUF4334 domain-containing protein [Nocardia nova]